VRFEQGTRTQTLEHRSGKGVTKFGQRLRRQFFGEQFN
jgi:hypothetical protein